MDWSTFYSDVSTPDFTRMIRNPDEWQVALAEYIRQIVGSGELLEAGCGYGLTSLLIGENVRRTLLDLEPKAIEMSKSLFSTAKQRGNFIVGDIFDMELPDNCFDVVFNAGVLEHFDFNGRRAAILEMVRVTKPGGKICVAVPNHYSVPYRFAYEYRQTHGTWQYPDEEKLFDFTDELSGIDNIVHLSRITTAEKSSFYFLSKPQKLWFKFLHLFYHFEGYLAIVTLEKKQCNTL